MTKEVTNKKEKQYKEIVNELKIKWSILCTIIKKSTCDIQKISIFIDDITKLIDDLDDTTLTYTQDLRLGYTLSSMTRLVRTFHKETKWNRLKRFFIIIWIDSLIKYL